MTDNLNEQVSLRIRVHGLSISDVVAAFESEQDIIITEKKSFGGSHDHLLEIALILLKYGPDAAIRLKRFAQLCAEKFDMLRAGSHREEADKVEAAKTRFTLVVEDSAGRVLKSVDLSDMSVQQMELELAKAREGGDDKE